jgi:UDP-GlcNAc:undecaprenyl-phosphate GlcNAc-1-phosphate transferase
MITIISFFIAFLVAFLATPLVRILAVRLRVLDLPNKRKIHKRATPLLGGLAIYAGIVCGLLYHMKTFSNLLPVFIGATIIVVMGVLDDWKGLSARLRLTIQILVALMIIGCGMRVSFLPQTFWGIVGEVAITVFWIVGLTNAFNCLDGMDGLATGSCVVNAFCFAALLYSSGQYHIGLLAVTLIAACLGFLPFNLKKAKIFLGESGSTLLGFSLANIALIGNWAGDNLAKLFIPILVLGVPIFDMIFTTVMRIKEEKIRTVLEWLEYVGKDHFHHYLVDLGLTPFGAVIFIYSVSLSLGLSALMLSNDTALEAILSLSQAAIIFGIIATLIVVGKRRHSGWKIHENEPQKP